jgi:hypothetical protein
MTTPDPGASDDPAAQALEELIRGIDSSIAQLQRARSRARQLLAHREAGRTWLDIVAAEKRPLVVERVSAVLATLADTGGAWRREEAAALRRERVSINRIAALFGVTRQRISALLHE